MIQRAGILAALALLLVCGALMLAACDDDSGGGGPTPTLAPLSEGDEATLRALAADFLDAASTGDLDSMRAVLAERLRADDDKLQAFVDCPPAGYAMTLTDALYSLDVGTSIVEVRIGLVDETGNIVENGTDLWGFERQPDSTWLLATIPVCLFTDAE